MYKFLKAAGLGLLYALLTPFMIVVFAFIAVFYGIPNFLVKLVQVTINFFKGTPLFTPLEEDVRAEEILHTPVPEPTPAPAQQPTTTNVYLQTNYYPGQQQGFPNPSVAPQQNPQVAPHPQPQFIDTTAQPLPNQPDPYQIPRQEQPCFGADLLGKQKEDEE